ncbi:hypothetical protein LCGC14_0370650 [marine sediment metagenome]|uniref:Uncharacterized protein n=1 Tax=marine sediment metagenome TaxID=412755 RepID=A0A0F9TB47_9ZZZZ|nr:hypothetical protein [Maribacter sp.]HDZ04899.1 hypothetical protein [Maribacter sp.]
MGTTQEIRHFLNGKQIIPPVEWKTMQFEALFSRNSIEASIKPIELTFVNEAATIITDHINGQFGIFVQIPYNTEITKNGSIFRFANYLTEITEVTPVKYTATLVKINGMNDLLAKAEGVTFKELVDSKAITVSDYTSVPFQVVPTNDDSLTGLLQFIVFYLFDRLVQVARDDAEDDNTSTSIVATGTPTSVAAGAKQKLGQTIIFALYYAILAAQVALLIVAIIKLFEDRRGTLKGISLKTLIEKGIDSLGYDGFETDITELEDAIYIPTMTQLVEDKNTLLGVRSIGIPADGEPGATLAGVIRIVTAFGNTKTAVINNVFHQRSRGDLFWQQNAKYRRKDVLNEEFKFNDDQLNRTKIISYIDDSSDDYTTRETEGKIFTVVTSIKGGGGTTITGEERIQIPLALGSRKGNLNFIEEILLGLAGIADSLLRAFGQKSNLAKGLTNRPEPMKISQRTFSVPKLVFTEGNGLRPNHREKISTETLYEKYYVYDSFVEGSGQLRLPRSVEQESFHLDNWIEIIESGEIIPTEGEREEAIQLLWTAAADKAELTYAKHQQYTNNLQEEKING